MCAYNFYQDLSWSQTQQQVNVGSNKKLLAILNKGIYVHQMFKARI